MHELCEIFRHAFGKRGDKGAISLFRCLLGLENKIVDLILDRLDLYRWINQSSGTNYLFAEDASCLVHLPRAGVADTLTVCGRITSHSLKRRGRLSMQLGRRKPYSASVIFRLWSPRAIAPICGTV